MAKLCKKIVVVHKDPRCQTCKKVIAILKKKNIPHTSILRTKLNKKAFDGASLVITSGGDGTILMTQAVAPLNTPFLTINSAPKHSEGALARITFDKFEPLIDNLLAGNYTEEKHSRLEVYINNKKLPTKAVNEFLIAASEVQNTFVYEVDGRIEKSSGVIVNTPLGSTAWALSAGGKRMSLKSKKLQYVIREGYNGKIYKIKKSRGFFDDEFSVKAKVKGVVCPDGLEKTYPFNVDDRITIKRAKEEFMFVY